MRFLFPSRPVPPRAGKWIRRILWAALLFITAAGRSTAADIAWRGWSPTLFNEATRSKRLVILDLEAVWCHWCHVMDKTTYSDPRIQSLIADHYVAVRVDQDSRPDLSNRYEDYGWPATIIYAPDGTELAKLSGYLPPARLASILEAFVKDPTPGPSALVAQAPAPTAGPLDAALRTRLASEYADRYDEKEQGWGTGQKFLDADTMEYTLRLATRGDQTAARRARATLDANRALIDPVWGGVYQYSTDGVWTAPHFEKIMSFQAGDLRTYADAYAVWRDTMDLAAVGAIRSFLTGFLHSPEGAFYTSQDADIVRGVHSASYFALDDAGRRAQGVPVIDRHRYARENGWAIEALAHAYAATGDATALDEAIGAARWIVAHRSLPDGGFRHDETDSAGPYLGDTLAMSRAFLSLYQTTADRAWLKRARDGLAFIDRTFRAPAAGYATARSSDRLFPSAPERDENIVLARTAKLLFDYTGDERAHVIAQHAASFVNAPAVAERFSTAGVLLADEELGGEPPHVTVIGSKSDPAARTLFQTALAAGPIGGRRLEWRDPADGKPVRDDVQYPVLTGAAAFVCADGRCSLPLVTTEKLERRLRAAPAP